MSQFPAVSTEPKTPAPVSQLAATLERLNGMRGQLDDALLDEAIKMAIRDYKNL